MLSPSPHPCHSAHLPNQSSGPSWVAAPLWEICPPTRVTLNKGGCWTWIPRLQECILGPTWEASGQVLHHIHGKGCSQHFLQLTCLIFPEIPCSPGTYCSFRGRRANRWVYSPFLAQPAFDLNFLLFPSHDEKYSWRHWDLAYTFKGLGRLDWKAKCMYKSL